MSCPFLREAPVKYCRSSSIRKLIPLAQAGRSDEKCTSGEWNSCPVFRQQPDRGEPAAGGLCPYLHESLMQYCAAAPVAKLVPYSESLLSRCGNDGYRYCELYLTMSHPHLAGEDVDGLPLPSRLEYSANHMWLDPGEDGACHIGIDAFLSRALGTVENISYVWQTGRHRPTAVLTVGGSDLEVVFPNEVALTRCNLYLRANPAKLASDPYFAGWLFEGVLQPGSEQNLIAGREAREWAEQEQRRMNEFLQQHAEEGEEGQRHAADGGLFAEGVVRHFDRDQRLTLFHEFFSPYVGRK